MHTCLRRKTRESGWHARVSPARHRSGETLQAPSNSNAVLCDCQVKSSSSWIFVQVLFVPAAQGEKVDGGWICAARVFLHRRWFTYAYIRSQRCVQGSVAGHMKKNLMISSVGEAHNGMYSRMWFARNSSQRLSLMLCVEVKSLRRAYCCTAAVVSPRHLLRLHATHVG